ncbi:MAG TPA: thioredoxin [Chthoniobacterales bacterium]|nr:thioredoxin [Chthoniobacterales bacterium]
MKSDLAPDDGRRPNTRAPSKNVNFSKHLAGVLRDIEENHSWKYDELCPVQLLEKLKLDKSLADRDEVERAEYFWSRRPRFLRAISWILWLLVAFGLPFWLFVVPAIGLPLLLLSAVVADTESIIDLDESNFVQVINQSSVPILVDFWAAWSGPCRMIAPVLDEIAKEQGENVKIAKVNVDEWPSLSSRFRIRNIPTLLFFKGGEVNDQVVGLASKEMMSGPQGRIALGQTWR